MLRGAVARTPEESPVYPAMLSSLGNALRALYEATGDPKALEEAVKMLRGAVARTPEESPDYPAMLSSLGNALARLHGATGGSALPEATGDEEALGEAAAEQLLEGGADYSAVPKNPDKALRIFYEVAEDLDKLGETVAEQPSEGAERAAIPDLKMWTLVLGWQKASFPFLLHGISGIPPLFYICPCKGCTHKKYIFQAPISPPLCPEHRVELVLDEEGAQRRDCDA